MDMGLVHDISRLTNEGQMVATACGVYLERKNMHSRPKPVTCLWCLSGRDRYE